MNKPVKCFKNVKIDEAKNVELLNLLIDRFYYYQRYV